MLYRTLPRVLEPIIVGSKCPPETVFARFRSSPSTHSDRTEVSGIGLSLFNRSRHGTLSYVDNSVIFLIA